jgi:putative ABC transport system permease protein
MNELIIGNLIHRPLRSVISAFAVAIEVVMILSITAVMLGMVQGSREQTSGIGMDMVVRPGSTSNLLTGNAASASVKVAQVLETLPHVKVAAPFNVKFSVGTSVENIFAIDYPSFNALRPFVFVSGGPFQGPNDIIVDDVFAQTGKGYHVGDTVKILSRNLRISGIVESGKGGRKMIPIDTLGALIGSEGKASQFFVKSDSEANEEAIRQEILHTPGFEAYQVQTMHEWLSMMTPDHIPGFEIALNVVTFIATLVGFLVIFLSMYTAILERTREIGILKSMGASKTAIVSMVLRESVLMSLVGIALGIGLVYTIHASLLSQHPELFFEITQPWVIKASVIAFLGAVLGAAYPAWLAARKDPIDALSYE